MRRRTFLLGLLAAPIVGVGPATAQNAPLELRIVGRPRDGQATFRLTNRLREAVRYESWDGGGVHNGLQRQVDGAWSDVGLGYCGLGREGDVTVAPGGAQTFRAHVGTERGSFRITLDVVRASGARETVVSAAFTVA